MSCKLFINNNRQSREKNKQLLKFLTNNVQELVNSGFVFHIITRNLRREGITATPSLKVNKNRPIVGTSAIIKYLIDSCEPETPPEDPPARSNCQQPEEVKDILMDIINDYREEGTEGDAQNETESKARILSQIESNLSKRNERASGNRVQTRSHSTKAPVTASTPDDSIMEKYWENIEETSI